VKAVILKIDSPGGEVMLATKSNKVITDFESDQTGASDIPAKKGKPVIARWKFGGERGYYIPRRAAGLSRTNSQSPQHRRHHARPTIIAV